MLCESDIAIPNQMFLWFFLFDFVFVGHRGKTSNCLRFLNQDRSLPCGGNFLTSSKQRSINKLFRIIDTKMLGFIYQLKLRHLEFVKLTQKVLNCKKFLAVSVKPFSKRSKILSKWMYKLNLVPYRGIKVGTYCFKKRKMIQNSHRCLGLKSH